MELAALTTGTCPFKSANMHFRDDNIAGSILALTLLLIVTTSLLDIWFIGGSWQDLLHAQLTRHASSYLAPAYCAPSSSRRPRALSCTSPLLMAVTTTCVRVIESSLSISALTWTLTVLSAMPNEYAIILLP